MKSIDEQVKIICSGADEVIDIYELREKLIKSEKENRPLVVKLGLDPSAPDIHIGHAVVLRKLKQIQDLGHKVVIIIGDFTGMIGDPTGKSKARKQLSKEEVMKNAKTYEMQIFKILDKNKTEMRFNSEWLSKLNFAEVIDLAAKCTVARMLEREDFKNRFNNNQTISIHEFFYPLMQAYDSINIEADIELGGTDQRFNILMGRNLQKEYSKERQIAIFMPILEGTDGIEKMSKSLGNYIGINEDAKDIYGKVMSISDNLIIKYFTLATDIHPDEIEKMSLDMKENKVNPRDLKMLLAKEIVRLYHGEEKAEEAENYFKTVFQNKTLPVDIPTKEMGSDLLIEGKINIAKLIVLLEFAISNSEARRLVLEGAVKINGKKVTSIIDVTLKNDDIIMVGKRKFCKIVIQ